MTAPREFANRAELAAALAREVAGKLSAAITRKGSALLAVSGGTTPRLFFETLSQEDICWEKVLITLVDERDVPETSERSNARLVKAALLVNKAAAARFIPLHNNPEASSIQDFDCCILGMGNDGHTASFFPGGDTLAQMIDLSTMPRVARISAPGAGEPRLTFTLSKLLASYHLMVHIEGAEKRRVLSDAESGSDEMQMPIRAVLQAKKPIEIYWCP